MSPIFKKTRTAVVEAKPELPSPAPSAPPIVPAALVASPPQSAPTQLDRIEEMLKRAVKRLQC